MAITISSGVQPRYAGIFRSVENLSQSTATAAQAVSLSADVTTFSGGTATGYTVDRYLLAAGAEGQHKTVIMLATGEAKMDVSAGTSTGANSFTVADDMWIGHFVNGSWRIIITSAATTTATNTA